MGALGEKPGPEGHEPVRLDKSTPKGEKKTEET